MSRSSISRRFNISTPSQPAKANIRQSKVQQSDSTQYGPLNCTITGSGLMVGTSGMDVMCANGTANILALGANDTLYAYNGTGTTYLNGGSGADQLIGGNGTNIANYSDSSSAITVDIVECAQGCMSPGSDADGDTMINITGVIGSNSDDVISAGLIAPPVLNSQFSSLTFLSSAVVGPYKNYIAIVWSDQNGINGQIFSANGTNLSSIFYVSNYSDEENPQVFAIGQQIAVIWSQTDTDLTLDIYMRFFHLGYDGNDVQEQCMPELGTAIIPTSNVTLSNSTSPCTPLLLLENVTNYKAIYVSVSEMIFLAYQINLAYQNNTGQQKVVNQTISGVWYQLNNTLSKEFDVVSEIDDLMGISLFSVAPVIDGEVIISWKRSYNSSTPSSASPTSILNTVDICVNVFSASGQERTATQIVYTLHTVLDVNATKVEPIDGGQAVGLNNGGFAIVWVQIVSSGGGESYLRLYNSSYLPQSNVTLFEDNYIPFGLLASGADGFLMVGGAFNIKTHLSNLQLMEYGADASLAILQLVIAQNPLFPEDLASAAGVAAILSLNNSGYVIPFLDGDGSVSLSRYPTISASYVFWGLRGNDTLTGAFGNDVFHPGPGNNTVNGLYGIDAAVYDDLATDASIAVALDVTCSGLATRSNGEFDALTNIVSVSGTPHNDNFSTLCNMSVFAGGGGSNTYLIPQPTSPTFAQILDFGSLDTILAHCACSNVSKINRGQDCQVQCSDATTLYTYDIDNMNCSSVYAKNTAGNGGWCSITAEINT